MIYYIIKPYCSKVWGQTFLGHFKMIKNISIHFYIVAEVFHKKKKSITVSTKLLSRTTLFNIDNNMKYL